MTDRYHALVVVLERDTRDDDAKALINVIKSLRGVEAVTGEVVDIETYSARERALSELREKLWDVVFKPKWLDKEK